MFCFSLVILDKMLFACNVFKISMLTKQSFKLLTKHCIQCCGTFIKLFCVTLPSELKTYTIPLLQKSLLLDALSLILFENNLGI